MRIQLLIAYRELLYHLFVFYLSIVDFFLLSNS